MLNYKYRKDEIKLIYNMVYLKCKINMGEEYIVGEVVEFFFGKYVLFKILIEGLDFVVVKIKC